MTPASSRPSLKLPPFLAAVCLLGGCATPEPNLRALYEPSARYHDARRNPIVVIPGILGSNLKTSQGRVVWGAFTSESVDPETPEGARTFSHPMGSGPLRSLIDGVHPAGALEIVGVDILGLHFELGAYVQLLETLGVGGYQDQQLGLAGLDYGDDHYTCFQFDYDWRRDNVENAARLKRFLEEKKAYVEAENKRRFGDDSPVKFDVVAHSMGGLLTRYFLRYGDAELPEHSPPPPPTWAGAELVERVILVGVPNAGSVSALRDLVEGVQLSRILPEYPAAVVGSLPAAYQLLPRARHGAVLDANGDPVPDLLDPELWLTEGWGLLAPDQEPGLARLLPDLPPEQRREIAEEHLRKCLGAARRFQAALDQPASPPPGCEIYLVAGDAVATEAVVRLGKDGGLETVIERAGDGTVTRDCALMDERQGSPVSGRDPHLISPVDWTSVLFVFSDHLGMTHDPSFTDNVLYLLLVDPRENHSHAPPANDESG